MQHIIDLTSSFIEPCGLARRIHGRPRKVATRDVNDYPARRPNDDLRIMTHGVAKHKHTHDCTKCTCIEHIPQCGMFKCAAILTVLA